MYFRELVRYIHLNRLRAKIVSDIKELFGMFGYQHKAGQSINSIS